MMMIMMMRGKGRVYVRQRVCEAHSYLSCQLPVTKHELLD